MTNAASAPSSNRTLPMSVANMTFMVDKLGEDCAPLQFVRELTQNAIQSVQKSPESSGEVRWDVAWHHYALTDSYKLAVIDNGIGMTGKDMVEYINKLSSSIQRQSKHGNFGVGAKISALPKNPEGLLYLSWNNGIGYIVHLWRDPETEEYGLKRWDHPDGRSEYWGYIGDELKPDLIKQHGTMVVLLGNNDKENTMLAPSGTPMPSRWILRYLNTRYLYFPRGVVVKAREGWEKGQADRHSFLREVTGQKPWLDANSDAKGAVPLETALAHWWILKESIDDDSGHYAPGGHMAALYQGELYEMHTGRAGVAKLQGFGVIFGCKRVVMYLEPLVVNGDSVSANIARTNLVSGGQPLPWSEWAAEFREKLPTEIAELMDDISAKTSSTDHRTSIRDRLKRLRELFRFSRYRPAKDGKHQIDSEAVMTGESRSNSDSNSRRNGSERRGKQSGDVYSLFLSTHGGLAAEEFNTPVDPDRDWITLADGTRTEGDLEDRAARFLPDQNRLLINGDFRVFTDMVDRWAKKYTQVPGARHAIEEVVREWFEQQLVETIMGAMALRQSGQWTLEDLKRLWNEESLTAAVLPRYHVDIAINRGLGSKLGTLKEPVN